MIAYANFWLTCSTCNFLLSSRDEFETRRNIYWCSNKDCAQRGVRFSVSQTPIEVTLVETEELIQ